MDSMNSLHQQVSSFFTGFIIGVLGVSIILIIYCVKVFALWNYMW